MEQKSFIEYLENGTFEILMQGLGVEFELNKNYSNEYIKFMSDKEASSFYFVSFQDISKIVAITNPDQEKAYLDDSEEAEISLLTAIGETNWTYYHVVFRTNSVMASIGGIIILNVNIIELKNWLSTHGISWYVFGDINATAQYKEI